MIKDPLIDKNPNNAAGNILEGINSDPNAVSQNNQTNVKNEENNPFAAFMKLNAMSQETNKVHENLKVSETPVENNIPQ